MENIADEQFRRQREIDNTRAIKTIAEELTKIRQLLEKFLSSQAPGR